MEIKDINVSLERLDDVRGGQYIDVTNAALQVGGNSAYSSAESWGVGNKTSSAVTQIAPQKLVQGASVDAVELDLYKKTIDHSVVGFGFPLLAR